jgi:hypothetical protein
MRNVSLDTPRRLPWLVLAAMALGGCGDPTVDASTDESMKASIERVRASVKQERRDEFENAIKVIAFADVDGLGSLAALSATGGLERALKDRINGKSADEIMSEARRIKADSESRKRESQLLELAELGRKLAGNAPDLLSQFIVERATFERDEGAMFRENVIELSVKNGTDRVVSHAFFRAILQTPGRQVPWVDAEFNYEIPGGIESGESAVWRLSPNIFGEWSKAPTDRVDTLFIVRPVALEGPGGQRVASNSLEPREEARLRELLALTGNERAHEFSDKLNARAADFDAWKSAALGKAARSERLRLVEIKNKAATDAAARSRFKVSDPRFYFTKDVYRLKPVIALTVRNDTGRTVSRFHARGALTSTGREKPWVEDTFNYEIPGGLGDGESRHFELAPNSFGPWASAPSDRDDMTMTIVIERIDGADGEPLFCSEFREKYQARLNALEKMIEENNWR